MPEMWREKTAFVFAFFSAILLATNVKADDITDEYVQIHGETVDSRRFTTGKQKVRDGAVYYFFYILLEWGRRLPLACNAQLLQVVVPRTIGMQVVPSSGIK